MKALHKLLPKPLRAGLYWNEAWELTAKENYVGALNVTEKIEEMGVEFARLPVLKGLLQQALGDFGGCIITLKGALTTIEESPLSKESKEYLIAFSNYVGRNAEKNISREGQPFFKPVEYSEIDLDRVPKYLIQEFQLTEHPEWGSQNIK